MSYVDITDKVKVARRRAGRCYTCIIRPIAIYLSTSEIYTYTH